MSKQQLCGLGDSQPTFSVYIANRPPLDEYQQLTTMKALVPGEIASIAQQTGNHWRKIFNVYAKLVFELNDQGLSTWQQYREAFLLQTNSKQALLFSRPDFSRPGLHLVMGRTYARDLKMDADLIAVDADFQVAPKQRLLVVPYFDYRQLSNEKLARLRVLIHKLSGSKG